MDAARVDKAKVDKAKVDAPLIATGHLFKSLILSVFLYNVIPLKLKIVPTPIAGVTGPNRRPGTCCSSLINGERGQKHIFIFIFYSRPIRFSRSCTDSWGNCKGQSSSSGLQQSPSLHASNQTSKLTCFKHPSTLALSIDLLLFMHLSCVIQS